MLAKLLVVLTFGVFKIKAIRNWYRIYWYLCSGELFIKYRIA